MTLENETGSKPLGLVWIDCTYPVATAVGLARILEGKARVHVGREGPRGESPSLIVFVMRSTEDLPEGMKRIRGTNPNTPVLVFGLQPDPPLVRAALKVGARGFIHAMMPPKQIIRALEVAAEGEVVVPRS